jgi:hypothetical protein
MEPYSDFKIEGYNEKENYYKRKKKKKKKNLMVLMAKGDEL